MSNQCGCSRPTRAGYVLCDTCKGELEQHLAEMRWLDSQLEVSLTRAKGVDYRSGGPRSADRPLPWNERASNARDELKAELVGWVRIMAPADRMPGNTLPDLAAWLLSRLERISKRDDAWVIFDSITGASIAARALVFAKPADRHYVGPCEGAITDDGEEIVESECDGEIWLTEGASEAECMACKRAYEPAAAIRARDDLLADRLFTLVEIADLAHRTFGQPRDRVLNTAKGWQKRGQIVAHAHVEGTARFRYQEVLDRLANVYGEGA